MNEIPIAEADSTASPYSSPLRRSPSAWSLETIAYNTDEFWSNSHVEEVPDSTTSSTSEHLEFPLSHFNSNLTESEEEIVMFPIVMEPVGSPRYDYSPSPDFLEYKIYVLLIEAGDEEPEAADIPAFVVMMQNSNLDWKFATQPQPNSCRARPQGRCNWPRGKVMGGSSTINYMIYLRGGPKDFDEWEHMGNSGWSYKDVLPYFIKSEHNNNIEKFDKKFHGTNGEMNIEYYPYQDKNVFHLLDAYKELGLNEFDQNSNRQVGTSLMQHFLKDGKRFSANAAFIRPIRGKRKNLFLKTNAFVTKLLIKPETRTTYGVEYFHKGQYFKALAKKEVIVSTGTLSSPKLLMVSGIGPARHLHELNIKVLNDLKVGHNLHDHTTADGPIFALAIHSPLAATATIQVNSFIQTKYETEEDRPDMQFTADTVNVEDYYNDPILVGAANIRSLAYYNGLMVRPILLAPKSRGYILLNRTHPVFGDPLIFPNTFYEYEDLTRMVEGIKWSLNITHTNAMKSMGTKLITIPVPACDHLKFGTDAYWRCLCISYTATLFHPVGTCKMGPKYDPDAVVDPESLKVYGIKRLRVIDASVIPLVTRANTNAVTMMVAERGADFIKRDWIGEDEDDEETDIFSGGYNKDEDEDF
ncbi:hypothetical protein NQ314_018669, partial [Rhamnusium bicolor]